MIEPASALRTAAGLAVSLAFVAFWVYNGRIFTDRQREISVALAIRLTSRFKITYDQAINVIDHQRYVWPPILASAFVGVAFDVDLLGLFAVRGELSVLALAIIGTMSTIQLLPAVLILLEPSVDFLDEVMDVGWIGRMQDLPGRMRVLGPVASACAEELFFRGALLLAFVEVLSLAPWLALTLVTALFVLEQSLFLTTPVQGLLIGEASLLISVVGGVLVLHTGSIWPAMVVHGSFALFYVQGMQDSFEDREYATA